MQVNLTVILDLTWLRYDSIVLKKRTNTISKTTQKSNLKKECMVMKKIIGLGLSVLMTAAALAGCGGNGGAATSTAGDSSANAATTKNDSITVVSREDGSGTRGAFIELFGIEEKDADGNKVDHTTENAEITNSTAVMLASIPGQPERHRLCLPGLHERHREGGQD